MCPSSGELIVSIRHVVYVTLYRWPFDVQVWMSLVWPRWGGSIIDSPDNGLWLPETCSE
jgi:hypothetical protein